ncbi:hypothetical protein D6774_04980 [Candidatus Woesearchaeota archaeon]|nr:MAG: hypothetical protein D6774_04980 [Candidatus Woesearchaeota archaeon]
MEGFSTFSRKKKFKEAYLSKNIKNSSVSANHMKKVILAFLVFLLLPSLHAATITGTIYDAELHEMNISVLEINTQPVQRLLIKNGSYSITVPSGSYTLYAHYQGLSARESITVKDDGVYHLDLFLYPDLEKDEELITIDTTLDEELSGFDAVPNAVIVATLLITGLLIILFLHLLKKKKDLANQKMQDLRDDRDEEKSETSKSMTADNIVIDLLKEHGGRMTQKELRKHIPLSEAKVSLMVSELEAENKIKKIKKGRTNILILQ